MANRELNRGEIVFFHDGIYIVQGRREKVRVADPIRVTAFATSDPGSIREQAFTVVEFLNRRGKWKREIVPAPTLTAAGREFVGLLSSRGYIWPPSSQLRARIVGALSVVKPTRNIRVSPVPGHHGKFFVLPDESYGPEGPVRKRVMLYHNPTVQLGQFQRRGTLGAWKKCNATTCVHSSRARLAVSTVFAAPNLRPLKLNSFGFNFSGPTSGGKTLLIRLAASATGLNSDDGPATWDGSAAAFEQRALGHRDCMMSLDDISHLQGDSAQVTQLAKLVTFRLASNRPKAKAGQYIVGHNLVNSEFRVIPLSTSEDPLWEQVNRAGTQRRVRGEEVRMINIHAYASENGDIFDGPKATAQIGKTLEQRLRYVERQERLAVKYQGVAFRAYLAKRMADETAIKTLTSYMDEFLAAAPLKQEYTSFGRIRRLFAVVYASAAQAIDYGILPWGKKPTMRDILTCMQDAMDQLIFTADELTPELLLADFKNLVDNARFIRVERNRRRQGSLRLRLKGAHGIVRPTMPGKVEYLLFSDTLNNWFPNVNSRIRLTKLLRSRGVFKEGRRSDTSTRQVLISALNKRISCYTLSRKRLSSAT